MAFDSDYGRMGHTEVVGIRVPGKLSSLESSRPIVDSIFGDPRLFLSLLI